MPPDFHVPTKTLFNLQVSVTEGLKIGFKRRRLVGGFGFEKMRVASWHIQNPAPPNSIYIWASVALFPLESSR